MDISKYWVRVTMLKNELAYHIIQDFSLTVNNRL